MNIFDEIFVSYSVITWEKVFLLYAFGPVPRGVGQDARGTHAASLASMSSALAADTIPALTVRQDRLRKQAADGHPINPRVRPPGIGTPRRGQ